MKKNFLKGYCFLLTCFFIFNSIFYVEVYATGEELKGDTGQEKGKGQCENQNSTEGKPKKKISYKERFLCKALEEFIPEDTNKEHIKVKEAVKNLNFKKLVERIQKYKNQTKLSKISSLNCNDFENKDQKKLCNLVKLKFLTKNFLHTKSEKVAIQITLKDFKIPNSEYSYADLFKPEVDFTLHSMAIPEEDGAYKFKAAVDGLIQNENAEVKSYPSSLLEYIKEKDPSLAELLLKKDDFNNSFFEIKKNLKDLLEGIKGKEAFKYDNLVEFLKHFKEKQLDPNYVVDASYKYRVCNLDTAPKAFGGEWLHYEAWGWNSWGLKKNVPLCKNLDGEGSSIFDLSFIQDIFKNFSKSDYEKFIKLIHFMKAL